MKGFLLALLFIESSLVFAQGSSFQTAFWNTSGPVPPSNLSLSHSTRMKTFTASWSGGAGYANCVIQNFNGSTWVTIAAVDCNSDGSGAFTLSNVGNNWNGRQVRIAANNGAEPLVTFPQTLLCSKTVASSTSTPNIDEDCNGNFNNTYIAYRVIPITNLNFGSTYNCPATTTNYDNTVGETLALNFSGVSFNSSAVHFIAYDDNSCTQNPRNRIKYFSNGSSLQNLGRSGNVPNWNTPEAYMLYNPGCQLWFGNEVYKSIKFNPPLSKWESGQCEYTGDGYYL